MVSTAAAPIAAAVAVTSTAASTTDAATAFACPSDLPERHAVELAE